MRVLLKSIAAQILLNIYIFWWGWKILPKNKAVRTIYTLIFGVELFSYLLLFFASDYLPLDVVHNLAWITTAWVIFLAYMGGLLLIYDLFRFIEKRKKIFPTSIDLNSKKLKTKYYFFSLLLVLSVMVYGNYRFRNPVVTEMTLNVEKQASGITDMKIIMVSDMHVGYLINKNILNKYVDQIMAQKPDLILIVGDIIDYDLYSVKEQKLEEEFHRLKAPYGVYASTGNHEYIQLDKEKENEKIIWLREKSGLTLLQDTAILIQNSFYLVGREDDKCEGRKSFSQITKGLDKDLPLIVMNHEPHNLQEEVDCGADIALYGHTHDGQVFPNNILMRRLYEKSFGYKQKDNTHIYVSSGLGLAGPQFRIGTISEIVVLNVKFKK